MSPDDSATDVEPILDAQQISVRFGALQAVDNVDCRVARGEILGLIGPNGAGKSTLVNAISGLVPMHGGSIRLRGQDLTTKAAHLRFRNGLGRTFQKVSVVEELTVKEFAVVAEMQGNYLESPFQWHSLDDRSEEIVSHFGLQDLMDMPVGALSYMHKRLMAIAASIIGDVEISLLDESTAGLSDTERRDVGHVLKELVATMGISLVVIEHDLEFVGDVADRVLVMDQGRLLAEGEPSEVLSDPDVVRAYVGT